MKQTYNETHKLKYKTTSNLRMRRFITKASSENTKPNGELLTKGSIEKTEIFIINGYIFVPHLVQILKSSVIPHLCFCSVKPIY